MDRAALSPECQLVITCLDVPPLALAVNNDVVLELGYGSRGVPAENHHVAPVHPAYAELPPIKHDPEEAMASWKKPVWRILSMS